ncbi:TetR/AcrR family transcriptional regulator [Skermania sp. ID1734]|uniref:TetR/AcrR family transcriptional regulator n=1 Tax=Skermania sp. ID1734 TaxID=2597516 RepID=UPI001180BF1F|nr:TetR/AcrR family transcriptional regulator [Skermania sp. ID1734]TSD99201.1 TetR/AcrR family transcriptional regulator [Skermania sp. ID1734]
MVRSPAVVRARRTQEERSAETRAKLLDATIECLVEYGYAGTTTPRVAAKAGVTRGAQVHHFPSKADLVTAAVRHLATKRAEEAIRELSKALGAEDALSRGLDLLWEIHQGPLFVAAVELWVAARTDPELAGHVAQVEKVVTTNVTALGSTIVPGVAEDVVRDFTFTAMDTMRGILVSNYVHSDRSRVDRQWRRVRAQLLRLAKAEIVAAGEGTAAIG